MAARIKPQLVTLTNTDRAFYPTLGPFLANKAVHKQLGGVPWDEDLKTWFILKDKTAGVLGFCAVTARGPRTLLESLYTVDPTHQRITEGLVAAAVAKFGTRDLHATVRHSIVDALTVHGFQPVPHAAVKNFVHLTRPGVPQ